MVGLFGAIAAEARERAAPKIADNGSNAFGWLFPTSSGKWVDEAFALRVSTVYACVALIAGTIGSLPLHVFDRRVDGRVPLRLESEKAVWDKPNPEVSRTVFWETAVAHAVLTGNAYIYVVPDGTSPRRAAELWPIDPKRVKVGRNGSGEKVYLIDGTRPAKDWVAGGEIVHVPGLGTDGLVGLSPIQLAAQSIGLAASAEELGAKLFAKGTMQPGYLATDQKLTMQQAKELSEVWEKHHSGNANAFRLPVLGGGTEWKTTSMNPEDMQMLATRKYGASVISAQWFGVPPEMVGAATEGSSLTYANVEDRMLQFVTFTLQRWTSRFEQTISDELLRPHNHYAKFDYRGLLRGNSTQRAQFYQSGITNRWLLRSEVRELEEMKPIEGIDDLPVPEPAKQAATNG